MPPAFDFSPYRRHFQASVATAPPSVAAELRRLGMAPFASDPVMTLVPAPLMVVSMKPYGAAGLEYPHGWEERAERPGLHRWYDGDRRNGNFVREADLLLTPLLARVAPHLRSRQVFNTYAYFQRARDARQLREFGLDRLDCRTFHRHFLEVVRPRIVLCIGNGPSPSAFATYTELFANPAVERTAAAPRSWVKHFRPDGGPLVIGVPHLSYARAATLWPVVADLLS